tara:strand:+ start:116988 stop:117380 length:393 start_codon:yes stop_codon:yes gene_type:complete
MKTLSISEQLVHDKHEFTSMVDLMFNHSCGLGVDLVKQDVKNYGYKVNVTKAFQQILSNIENICQKMSQTLNSLQADDIKAIEHDHQQYARCKLKFSLHYKVILYTILAQGQRIEDKPLRYTPNIKTYEV